MRFIPWRIKTTGILYSSDYNMMSTGLLNPSFFINNLMTT